MCNTTTRWWNAIRLEVMLRPFAIVLLFTGCAAHAPPQTGLYKESNAPQRGVLHLHCTWTDPYCGGAEPDPVDYPRPAPWSGPMFIRAAKPDSTGKMAINDPRKPVLDTIRMNSEGHGYLALPTGSYLFLDKARMDDRKYREILRNYRKPAMYNEPVDTACLRQWLHGPFEVLHITGGDTLHMEYPMHGQCPWYATPCVRYNGPLPP